MLKWPWRQSKGLIVIQCDPDDINRITLACSDMLTERYHVHCRHGKFDDYVFMSCLDPEVIENQLRQALVYALVHKIMDVFIIRLLADMQHTNSSSKETLLQELTLFVPQDK